MTEEKKTPLVDVNREKYNTAKTAAGGQSLNNGDLIATGLQGLTLDETYEVAGKFLSFPVTVAKQKVEDIDGLHKAYANLNDGMQRMNLGNRIRGQVAKIDKANEAKIAKAKKEDKDAPTVVAGEDKLIKVLSPYDKARDKRAAEAEKAKAAEAEKAKAAKAAKAAEAEKAKAAKAAEAEKAKAAKAAKAAEAKKAAEAEKAKKAAEAKKAA